METLKLKTMAVHTLIGANGTIGTALLPVLSAAGEQIRVFSRRPLHYPGAETYTGDVLNPEDLRKVISGSDYVYLLVGITYNAAIWARDWPVIMRNMICYLNKLMN